MMWGRRWQMSQMLLLSREALVISLGKHIGLVSL